MWWPLIDALPQVYRFDEVADQCWFDVRPKNGKRFSCENPGEHWVSCGSTSILPEGMSCDTLDESKAGIHQGPGIRLRGSTWPFRLRTEWPGAERRRRRTVSQNLKKFAVSLEKKIKYILNFFFRENANFWRF